MINEMLKFLDQSPTAFNAIKNFTDELDANGYERLSEKEIFQIEKGHKYYVTRNGSSLIAFNVGERLDNAALKIVASHSDCPGFKVKPNALIKNGKFTRLNVEVYGGPILSTWLDRPLGLAGRIIYRENGLVKTKAVNIDEDFAIIPSVAIHMNREANNGYKNNPQVDMIPLVALGDDFDLINYLKEKTGLDVVNYDLYLSLRQKAVIYSNKQFFSSNHIDNLECSYTSFKAFLNNFEEDAINICAVFDNEEVGSLTRQGANSDFMYYTIKRVLESLNLDYPSTVARSMLVSADNAHSVHPNHEELSDPVNRPCMNQGIVIKYNANQSYTSDALSSALFTEVLKKHDVPYQYFTNRSDMRGGGTLGNISNSHVSIVSVDIGLPQLAMHSCYETAGVKDFEYMIKGLSAFYQEKIQIPE